MAHDRNCGGPKRLGLLATAGIAAVGWALLPAAALAQAAPTVSQPVVQQTPNRMGITLNQALARLGQNPRDVDALVDAGNAALTMGDVDAAVGFFRRADQIAPGNGRVKAGLAGALVHGEDPFDAIPLFEEAEKAGASDGVLAGERGLAYDLVGDNVKAQRYYRLALSVDNDDEIIRRLALSYAIAGDRQASETVLTPLLQRQDAAAWRTRAFALAVLGQVDEAVSIAGRTLPPALSAGISPYLRYMPRLTPAQQAAAANLGHFPRASEIGRDDPRVALYAPKVPPKRPAQLAVADPNAAARSQTAGKTRRNSVAERREKAAQDKARLAANTQTAWTAPLGATSAAPAQRPSITRDMPPATTTTQRSRIARNQPARPAATTAGSTITATPAPALAVATQTSPKPVTTARRSTRLRNDTSDGPAFTQATRPRETTGERQSIFGPQPKKTTAPALAANTAKPPTTTPQAAATTTPRPAVVLPQTTPAPALAAAQPAPTTAAPIPGPSLSVVSPAVQGPPAPAAGELPPVGTAATTTASPPPATTETAPLTPPPSTVLAVPAVTPTPATPTPATPPPRPATLAEVFKEFLPPVKVDVAPVEGAVDIRHLTPSRESEARPIVVNGRTAPADPKAGAKSAKKVAAPVKPPPPSHPSRIWVQIATSRNKAGLAFDWRRISREAPQLFRGKQGFVSAWNQTNRLLTGPFPSEAAAQAFMTALRRADVDGAFLWTSPAGQVVDPIASK